jgi:hypothetical protein
VDFGVFGASVTFEAQGGMRCSGEGSSGSGFQWSNVRGCTDGLGVGCGFRDDGKTGSRDGLVSGGDHVSLSAGCRCCSRCGDHLNSSRCGGYRNCLNGGRGSEGDDGLGLGLWMWG